MTAEIVLATRFGASSAAPARVAAELAAGLGGRVTVIYVATELEALKLAGGEAGVNPADERDHAVRRIEEELDAFVAEYFPGGTATARVIEAGDVAEHVTRAAADLQARLLVVGTHSRGKLARLILGDTTQSILQRTPCPVVVVPLHEAEESTR